VSDAKQLRRQFRPRAQTRDDRHFFEDKRDPDCSLELHSDLQRVVEVARRIE
jgi:hypothetical protein